jgi:hypothetical protein
MGLTSSKSESRITGKNILLIEFPNGVTSQDMLSLYYGSNAPVGATGDQSFMEAYTMRSQRDSSSTTSGTDIWYDVSIHQRQLSHQLTELEEKTVNPDGRGQPGLRSVRIHPNVVQAIRNKNLLYPITMLVDHSLLQKQERNHQ